MVADMQSGGCVTAKSLSLRLHSGERRIGSKKLVWLAQAPR